MNQIIVSIVLPTYNSAEIIARTLDLILTFDRPDFELIVVENGSTDDTSEKIRIALKAAKKMKTVLTHSQKGLGNAIREGFSIAQGEVVAFVEDDLPFGFQEIDLAIEAVSRSDSNFAIYLSKYHQSTIVKRNWKRQVIGFIFRSIRDAFLSSKIRDTQGTFICKGQELKKLVLNTNEPGFIISTEIAYHLQRQGFVSEEVPVRHILELRGASTLTFYDAVQLFLGIIRIRFQSQ